MLEFFVLLILSLPQHNLVKLVGSIALESLSILESRFTSTPIYYFGTNPNDTRGCDESATYEAFITIFFRNYRFGVFPIKSDFFGYCLRLGAATMFGTLFQALLHVAIALIYFFSALLVSS